MDNWEKPLLQKVGIAVAHSLPAKWRTASIQVDISPIGNDRLMFSSLRPAGIFGFFRPFDQATPTINAMDALWNWESRCREQNKPMEYARITVAGVGQHWLLWLRVERGGKSFSAALVRFSSRGSCSITH